MSRKMGTKTARALFFYKIDSEKDQTYFCTLCNEVKSGKKRSNLVGHLLAMHRKEHDEKVLEQISSDTAREMQIQLLQCMVEKVTLNGRPFASLNDSGYVKSIKDKLDFLARRGLEIKLQDKKYTQIKAYISSTANKIKEKIKAETNDRHVSLMLDIATKNHKSILGINVRYIIGVKITERTIGMIPLTERHTSRNLAIEVKKCLDKFEITLKQVKSITTDNAANVVAIVDFLDEAMFFAIEEEAEVEAAAGAASFTSNVE